MPSMGSNSRENWFHGKASRSHIEELVKKAGADGSFAVRTSESVLGGYTLSLLFKGRVFTYRIIPYKGKCAIETNNGVQKKKFTSIDEMITKYRKAPNGLACGLTNPVGKSFSLFQHIERDLWSRHSAPARAQSAVTMPLPPIPQEQPFSSSSPLATASPVQRANSFDKMPEFQSANLWFHGNEPRVDVEGLVRNAKVDGSFAVRTSATVRGAYTLSVLYKGEVHTYRVLPAPCGRLAVQTAEGVYKKKYATIDELVHAYRQSRNGIVCALTNPVGPLRNSMSPYDLAR